MNTTLQAIKDHDILMKGSMATATLNDDKTHTRRVIKPQPPPGAVITLTSDGDFLVERWPKAQREMSNFGRCDRISCPYGMPGDRLRVRETHWQYGHWVPVFASQNAKHRKRRWVIYGSSNLFIKYGDHKPLTQFDLNGMNIWRRVPGIHMPHWASRLTLEIVSVRVERVQDISEADAMAEGCCPPDWPRSMPDGEVVSKPSEAFQWVWNSINAKRGHGWDKNDWVWVVEFKRLEEAR